MFVKEINSFIVKKIRKFIFEVSQSNLLLKINLIINIIKFFKIFLFVKFYYNVILNFLYFLDKNIKLLHVKAIIY